MLFVGRQFQDLTRQSRPWLSLALPEGENFEHFVAVVFEFAAAHTRNFCQLGRGARPFDCDLPQGRIREHHIGRHTLRAGDFETPFAQRIEALALIR